MNHNSNFSSKECGRGMSTAMVFILMFSVVSLFSDMTHESASSIRGAFLALLGASATVIGFVSGLGELVGYGMRYVFGRLTDRTHRYWPMIVVGYVLDIIAVPALALVGEHGWVAACALLIVQRMGKAIKKLGTEARKDIEEFTDKRCFLSLHIKVLKDWRNSDRALKSFGYTLED